MPHELNRALNMYHLVGSDVLCLIVGLPVLVPPKGAAIRQLMAVQDQY